MSPASTYDGQESAWQTFRAVVVEPRPAMGRMAVDPRAGQKGLLLLVVVGAILAAEAILLGWTSVRTAIVAALLPAIGIGAGAILLHLATRTFSYGSAFGRLAFALQVPAAVVNVPLQAVILGLTVVGLVTGPDDLSLVTSLAALASLLWTVALTFLAVRTSLDGCAAIGCTGALMIVTMLVAIVGLIAFGDISLDLSG